MHYVLYWTDRLVKGNSEIMFSRQVTRGRSSVFIYHMIYTCTFYSISFTYLAVTLSYKLVI